MEKKISVIVPIYNSEKYMKKCIDSIINQTYKNLEIILVNDGSDDSSLDICNEYKKKDDRVIVINKENGGASSARNKGLEVCSGDYISFVDSDDWIDNDTYELLSNEFNNDYDIIIFSSRNIYSDGTIKSCKHIKRQIMNSKKGLIILNSYLGITNGPCDKLYKRELFLNNKFPENVICEDYYLIPILFSNAKSILFVPIIKYNCYMRENSVSRNNKINMEYVNASDAQRKLINEKYPEISYIGNTAFVFANILIYNSYIKNDLDISNDVLKRIHDNIKKYRKDIIFNKYLPIKKKIQAIIYLDNLKLYQKIYKKLS